MNLIYGVLRQRYYLDNLLENLCRQPLHKIHPFVHQALAIGLYQIFFLDRIPDSAAVNESVKAVKSANLPKKLQGFVNGVLRECLRQKHKLPTPGDSALNKKALLNHPKWMTNRWKKRFGTKEMERICLHNNRQPSLVLRINTHKIDRDSFLALLTDKVAAIAGNHAPEAVILPKYQGKIKDIPGFASGYFQVQDEAAQLVTPLLAPFIKNGSYLDACAGLGGKTSHLLQLTERDNITLTAVEPEKQRSEKLQENLSRLFAHQQFSCYQGNLQAFAQQHPSNFHGILIDAPCSGTGVIGRHPDIRWNRREKDLQLYQEKQLSLLETAAGLIHKNGVVVYATCSLESEENEEVVEKFLARNNQFTLSDCSSYLPISARQYVNNRYFSPKPAESIDGFFAARLVCK